MIWKITYFNEKVEKGILNWPAKLIAKYLRIAELIMTEGPNLGMPFTRSMGEKLFEIRVKAKEGIGRAFFCIQVDKEIIILHEFIKKTDKTPIKELEIAMARMKELNN